MTWKKRQLNKYPDILISDCSIASIHVEKDKIMISFSEYGFFVKRNSDNKYFRTDGGQVVIEACDIDNISIKEIRMQQVSEQVYFETMFDVEPKKFLENINSGKWKLEIVEEFNAIGKGFYTGRIKTQDNRFWCHIKIYYKNLVYLWNNMRLDFPY